MEYTFDFFTTTMPSSRPADYYLGCLNGAVYLDFNNYNKDQVILKRISFDGYGCCGPVTNIMPMDTSDSKDFKEMLNSENIDQKKLAKIIKKTISLNKEHLWEDALSEYKFI